MAASKRANKPLLRFDARPRVPGIPRRFFPKTGAMPFQERTWLVQSQTGLSKSFSRIMITTLLCMNIKTVLGTVSDGKTNPCFFLLITFSDCGVYIDKSKVQSTTPLAATRSENGKTHLFYAGQTGNIVHSIDGSDSQDLVKFYPGSKLGAASVGNKLTLFYRSLNPVGEVVTHENDDGSWKPGVTVIKA
jgi:hypothetical protein